MVDNSDFALIETYPRWLIIPAQLDYDILLKSIHHRAKNRFPAITYRHSNGRSNASNLRVYNILYSTYRCVTISICPTHKWYHELLRCG